MFTATFTGGATFTATVTLAATFAAKLELKMFEHSLIWRIGLNQLNNSYIFLRNPWAHKESKGFHTFSLTACMLGLREFSEHSLGLMKFPGILGLPRSFRKNPGKSWNPPGIPEKWRDSPVFPIIPRTSPGNAGISGISEIVTPGRLESRPSGRR
jgi:hypothetical protein